MGLAKIWWKQDPDVRSHGGRLYLRATDDFYEAQATWDGYVDIYNISCTCGANCGELHIYDLDEFIERIIELKLRAIHHFGDTEYPACAPNIPAE